LAYGLLTNSDKDHQVEIALARAKILQQNFPAAETHVTQALSIDYENVEAWALWGHVKYLQLDFEAAKGIYRRNVHTKTII
jgi:Tfp pilus assembly protein PilF